MGREEGRNGDEPQIYVCTRAYLVLTQSSDFNVTAQHTSSLNEEGWIHIIMYVLRRLS